MSTVRACIPPYFSDGAGACFIPRAALLLFASSDVYIMWQSTQIHWHEDLRVVTLDQ